MFIRQTKTNNKTTGEAYFTHRLVRGERIGGQVRQFTVLNLGRHFPVKQSDWPLLCARLEQLLQPQANFLHLDCPEAIEALAQRYFGQLVSRSSRSTGDAEYPSATRQDSAPLGATPVAAPPVEPDFQEVDINSLQQTQPRSVGVEHLALHAMHQLGFVKQLTELGINGVMRAAIIGNIVGRMAEPASERATWNWLEQHSALGELLEVDFTALSHMRLYRASDLLMKHRESIESQLFSSVQALFSLQETVTLYDLTNTYLEGEGSGNEKANFGRSKEKRRDCPLITLGLVLDGSGFVRRSKTFAGNVVEGETLQTMLSGLNAPSGAMVIMDAGIATEANLSWLVEHAYRYLVVRRGGERQFEEADSVSIQTAGGETLRLQKVFSENGQEVELYCHSAGREAKETAMLTRFGAAFEAGLNKIKEGLDKPRSEKRYGHLMERIGRLKEKSRGASQHYTVTLSVAAEDSLTAHAERVDPARQRVTALAWEKTPVAGTMATHPGVYCLRSNELEWDEEKLWRTYTMLTDLESVFRSLKSELGLRPVFHSKEDRSDGHLFITVLAYQFVQALRVKLKEAGIHGSWARLRRILAGQSRVTASLRRKDGRTIHVRKSTVAETELKAIYQALGVNASPGGVQKLFV